MCVEHVCAHATASVWRAQDIFSLLLPPCFEAGYFSRTTEWSQSLLPPRGSRALDFSYQVCVASAFTCCLSSLVLSKAAFLRNSLRKGGAQVKTGVYYHVQLFSAPQKSHCKQATLSLYLSCKTRLSSLIAQESTHFSRWNLHNIFHTLYLHFHTASSHSQRKALTQLHRLEGQSNWLMEGTIANMIWTSSCKVGGAPLFPSCITDGPQRHNLMLCILFKTSLCKIQHLGPAKKNSFISLQTLNLTGISLTDIERHQYLHTTCN